MAHAGPVASERLRGSLVERARPEVAMLLLQLGAGQRSSAGAGGGECARTRCPCAMRDRVPIAVRSQWCMWTPRAKARLPGGPHPVTPGGEDASPGHSGELVARLCVVYSLRTVR